MLNSLISGIFKVIGYLASVVLSPIFTTISTVIPVLTSFFESIVTFLGYGLQYTSFFVKLLMIPKAPLVVLISFFATIFVFNISIRVVGLALAVYNYFKP